MTRPKPARESGYAMLLVFLMAAMIAIALYRELPRVAFEAQRAKEQLLIERGEQYKRAIQLFVRKVSRYPATMDELESLNNIRFLRKRYRDPMTGKEKWRLIHINGGVLTDSIIQKNKPGQEQQPQVNTNTFIGEGPIMGASNDPNQQQINPALRRRASDDRAVVTQEVPDEQPPPEPEPDAAATETANDTANETDNAGNDDSGDAPAPGIGVAPNMAQGTAPGMAQGMAPGMANIPGQNPQTPVMPGRIPQPGMYPPGAFPGQPGYNPALANPLANQGGMQGMQPNQISGPGMNGGLQNGQNTGQNNGQNSGQSSGGSVYVAPSLGQSSGPSNGSSNVNTGFNNGQPGPGQFGQQQGQFPGQQGGFPGRQGMFPGQQNNLPGQPQSAFPQGGFPGQMNSPTGNVPTGQIQNGPNNGFGLGSASNMQPQLPGMGGTQMGGGIAGVASESTGPAIKVYNERKKYNEWEFVYDQSKDRGLAGVQRGGGAPGTPAGQMGSMPGANPGQPGSPGGFGQTSPNGAGTVGGGIFGQGSSFGQQPQPQPQPQPQQPQN